jgi:hypothetical protein
MGRDELNLVEFPLATLADQPPTHCKTLVFEDRIWDKGQSAEVTRRLTISASDKYGLPTASDDEVILGLVQLSKAENFRSPTVPFSRYQLISLLGWRDEGRSYQRVEDSLKRWLGVTLYYENAWWDKHDRKWVDAHFHLLESVIIHHGVRHQRDRRREACGWQRSSFTWNPIVFQSFQAGYLKQIDMTLYRSLNLATAKRMFRFLDKRFYFGSVLRFELGQFAREHIGLSRSYDASQLKRRLMPAIVELEGVGFLERLASHERFCRLRRGCWEVVFCKKTRGRRSQALTQTPSPWAEQLILRGVSETTAKRIAKIHADDKIREKIDVFDQLAASNDICISKNPAGYLVQSIREDYAIPRGLKYKLAGQGHKSIPVQVAKKTKISPSDASLSPKQVENNRRLQECLHRLSAEEISRLEEEALKASPRLLAEGYRRAKLSGNARQLEGYRQTILQRHLFPMQSDSA